MAWGGVTHQHVEPGLGDGVGRGDLPEIRTDAPERARDVHDCLLAARGDEREEGLSEQRGADDVRLEDRIEVRDLEPEGCVEPAGVLRTSGNSHWESRVSMTRAWGSVGREMKQDDSRCRRC